MADKGFLIVESSGSPYEIGFAHGSKGRRQVLKSIETYKNMFMTYANLDWETAKMRSRSYIDPINAYDKDLIEEMRGIAEGAQVSLEDILALNARSEVIMMAGSAVPSDGCTSMAVLPECTADGHTILAQNWDWKGDQIDALLVLKIKSKTKPDITMVTEGGIIGKIGFNSAGLGVCLNALGTKGNPKGLPLHIVLRGILSSAKISDALDRINLVPNACAANYMIAHGEGEALDVEKAPNDFDVIYPDEGYMTHTNHFLTLRMRLDDTTRLMAPDSFIRKGRSLKLLKQKIGNINVETVKEILRDHIEYPDSICRHSDPIDDPGHQMCTVFSVVMDLTSKEMHVAKGNPCSSDYQLVL